MGITEVSLLVVDTLKLLEWKYLKHILYNNLIDMRDSEYFGDMWDVGGFVLEDLITYPIKSIIKKDLIKEGINPNSFERRGALVTTFIYSALVGSIAGGPLGFFIGLMGYFAVMGSKFPGDDEYKRKKIIALKAAEIATRVLEEKTHKDTWNRICDEVEFQVKKYSQKNPSIDKAVDLIYEAIEVSLRQSASCLRYKNV